MTRVLRLKNNSGLVGKFRIITKNKDTGEVITGEWQENLISSAENHGHNLIVKQLGGVVTYSLPITRARFGTTNVTPLEAHTDIDSPLAYDIEISGSPEFPTTKSVRIFFFAPSVFIPADTYYTFATYSNTQTFSMHLLDTPFVSAGNVDVTIEYLYSIANA